jgi:hypothetical protein
MDSAPSLPPWEQQPGEPPEAYARFLAYRNLGAGRSVAKARGKTRKKTQSLSGQWTEDCAAYNWVSRARAWDIENLRQHGAQLAVIWANCVIAAAEKALEALRDPECKPKDFDSAVAAVEKLSKYVSADALIERDEPAGGPVPQADAPLQLPRAAVA